VIALADPAPARAHLASTDLGPFYDGLLHALVSPEDLLVLLALAILAAYSGRGAGRQLVLALGSTWTLGTVGGYLSASGPIEWPVAAAGVILALGIVGMLAVRLPAGGLVAAAIGLGLVRGVMNGADARAADGSWLSVLGIATGTLVICILSTGLGSWIAGRRAAVVLRVASSWIAAIGLLMLGWQLSA
jgi:hydrogenase/urease accessory protein HupE